MTLIEVTDKRSSKEFLDVARIIYKNDENWVCPLDKDIENVFDPEENPYFKHGTAVRWVLKDDQGKLIGRIAAFIDYKTLNDSDQATGCCGFFECINNQGAANILFSAAKGWLETLEIKAMDGPVNFGETDKFWGLLVDGFTQPAYQIAYNPPYYQNLFETYGFKTYYKQEGFLLNLREPFPERFMKIAERVISNPLYTFEHFRYAEIDRFVADFTEIFNSAWVGFKKDFEPIETAYAKRFLTAAKAVIEEKFIWYGYNDGQPIAIYLMIPDVNQIFKHFNGKLTLWNKLRVLYMVKTNKMSRAKGVLMGVIPEFQKKGIESAFIWHLNKMFKKLPMYTEVEFSWVADYNPSMRKLWSVVGAKPMKQYITYRFLFDRNAEFKRYPIPD